MKIFSLIVLVSLLLIADKTILSGNVGDASWVKEGLAQDLNAANFFETVGKDKWVIVDFYTPSCFFCKKMQPEFNKFIQLMKVKKPDLIIAKLDCSENREICSKYKITGYPQIKMYQPGSTEIVSFFTSQRTVEKFEEWVNKVIN